MGGRYLYEEQIERFGRLAIENPQAAYRRYGMTLIHSADPKTYFQQMQRSSLLTQELASHMQITLLLASDIF